MPNGMSMNGAMSMNSSGMPMSYGMSNMNGMMNHGFGRNEMNGSNTNAMNNGFARNGMNNGIEMNGMNSSGMSMNGINNNHGMVMNPPPPMNHQMTFPQNGMTHATKSDPFADLRPFQS
jgi:transcription elongation factor